MRTHIIAVLAVSWLTASTGCGSGSAEVGPDSVGLALSGVSSSSVTSDSAVVTWTTNESATSEVEYGVTSTYGQSTPLYGLGTSHAVMLSALQAGTTYHYAVKSVDTAGVEATSGDATFTTLGGDGGAAGGAGDAGSSVAITCVQSKSGQSASTTTLAVTYPNIQSRGHLNVVVVGLNNTTSTVKSVADSNGNTYAVAAPLTPGSKTAQAIYYAKNIASGTNTVTVTLSAATPFVDVRVLEYAGLDTVSPLDASSSAAGASTAANGASSGPATAGSVNELIFGAGTTYGTLSAGSGFSKREVTPYGDVDEDKIVSTAGSYAATGTATDVWVMQAVAFKTPSHAGGPFVASLSPTRGPSAGGTTVTLNGANFVAGATVTFGGASATGVTVVSSTQLEATTPAHAEGTVDVQVKNPDSQTATLPGAYLFASANVNHFYVATTGSDATCPASPCGDGSPGKPWRTIQHCVDTFTLGTAGAICHVAQGTYAEGARANNCPGGEDPAVCIQRGGSSASAKFALQCDVQWTVPSSSAGCLIRNTSVVTGISVATNHVVVAGFDLSGSSWGQGLDWRCDPTNASTGSGPCPLGNDVLLENNYLHDIAQTSSSGPCGTGGPSSGAIEGGPRHGTGWYNTGVVIRGNRIQHYGDLSLARKNGGTCNQTHGIYPDTPYVVIENNLILDVVAFGIHYYSFPCQFVMTNNTVVRAGASGILASGGDCSNQTQPGINGAPGWGTIANNISVDNGNYGFEFDASSLSGQSCTTSSPNLISNNLASGNALGDYGEHISCNTPVNAYTEAPTSTFVSYLGSSSTAHGNDDLRLRAGSTAIGHGETNCAAHGTTPCTPTTDFAGSLRGNPPSIGAYE